MFAEHLILCFEQSLDGSHERATLTSEVRCRLALERCLKEVASADADTKGDGFLLCLACSILIDSIGAVQSTSFEEHRAERCARTFRSDEDDVDILWRHHTCAVVPVDGETMRIV